MGSRIRLNQQPPRHLEHSHDLTARLPLIAPQDPQAHAAFIVVADVRVVYFRLETEDGRFERVIYRQRQQELECTTLRSVQCKKPTSASASAPAPVQQGSGARTA